MATKLERLLIKEISGVDDPANETPGWMVAKSAETSGDSAAQIVIHQHISPAPGTPDEAPASPDGEALSVVGKIKALLTGKEDIEMTKEEMNAELDARFEGLTETLKSLIPAPSETPAPIEAVVEVPAAEAPATEDAQPVLTNEDLTKAVQDGLAPFLEVIDKTLDRIAGIEDTLAIRKSLDGQEERAPESADNKPTLDDAFSKALAGHRVELS